MSIDSIAPLIVAGTGLFVAAASYVRSLKKDREVRQKAEAAKEEARRLDTITARKDYVEQGFELMKRSYDQVVEEMRNLREANRRCEDRNDLLVAAQTEMRITIVRLETRLENFGPTSSGGPTLHLPIAVGPITERHDTPPNGIPTTSA